MTWLTALEIVGMVLTAAIIFLLVKEIRKSIKESNNGRTSDKCDLD